MGAVYRRPQGAPVVALGGGLIRRVGLEGDDGLVVEIELDAYDAEQGQGQGEDAAAQVVGQRVRYAHLMRTIGELQPGDRVEQGQIIGLVGQTGKTPAPRLRLELLDAAGERLDPMALGVRAPRAGDFVPEDQLERFGEDIRSWRRAMRKAGE
nr:M23 family metallopeptidase [Pseudenhygromyxa sp. WMMC2535]